MVQQSGAGWAVAVVASGNNDARDDRGASKNGNDNAATFAEIAFFLRSCTSTLYRSLYGGFRGSCRLSDNRGAEQRRGCNGSERNFTETHFFGSFLSCDFQHTAIPMAQWLCDGKRGIFKFLQIVISISIVARL
jgi:hypothetical protein